MRVARTSLGLTQEAFGRKFGFSRANVCDIEKGRCGVSPLIALKVARKAGLPEDLALQACLQELVYKAGSQAKVVVI
jgi:DNA-binding XRE family transcriptional regulator